MYDAIYRSGPLSVVRAMAGRNELLQLVEETLGKKAICTDAEVSCILFEPNGWQSEPKSIYSDPNASRSVAYNSRMRGVRVYIAFLKDETHFMQPGTHLYPPSLEFLQQFTADLETDPRYVRVRLEPGDALFHSTSLATTCNTRFESGPCTLGLTYRADLGST